MEAWTRTGAERHELVARARGSAQWATQGVRTAVHRPDDNDKGIRFARTQGAERMPTRARAPRRRRSPAPVDKPWDGWDLRLQIASAGRSGDVVARLAGATLERACSRSGRSTSRSAPATASRLVGPNGSGKSTFVAALLGESPIVTGSRWVGPGVVIGEIGQAEGVVLRAGTTARTLRRRHPAGHQRRPPRWRSSGSAPTTPCVRSTRCRRASARGRRWRCRWPYGVNFLVLDEPTNHLDLPASTSSSSRMGAFDGTLLLVTHDRRLRSEAAITRTWSVAAGAVVKDVGQATAGITSAAIRRRWSRSSRSSTWR